MTGNPGSGKSTVAAELSRRGFVVLDPDYDPELSHWLDADGRRTKLLDGPDVPTESGYGHTGGSGTGRGWRSTSRAVMPLFSSAVLPSTNTNYWTFSVRFICSESTTGPKNTVSSRMTAPTRPAGMKRVGSKSGRDAQHLRPRCFSLAQLHWTERCRLRDLPRM